MRTHYYDLRVQEEREQERFSRLGLETKQNVSQRMNSLRTARLAQRSEEEWKPKPVNNGSVDETRCVVAKGHMWKEQRGRQEGGRWDITKRLSQERPHRQ